MRNETRILFDRLLNNIATLNKINDASKKFNVSPSIQQKLEKHIQESTAFLGMINIIPVKDQTGEVLGLDAVPFASRTNTSAGKRRNPTDVTSMGKLNEYHCRQTNYDTAIKYAKLDAWASHPDFEIKLRDLVTKSQALARIMIGFNGTSHAADTDITANPLLQDVNKGWLQKYRENHAENVMTGVTIGTGGTYQNLDAAVYDAVNTLIDPLYRDDDRLRVIIGRNLVNNRHFPMLNKDNAPTEVIAANQLLGLDVIGGVKAMTAPYFPENGIFITPLENLSIYWQDGSRRRHVKDEPEYDRVADYQSSNDDYVVEHYEAGCVIENITAATATTTTA